MTGLHSFSVSAQSGNARCGEFITKNGAFSTPQFMPVGTKATVKGIDAPRLQTLGAQIMLVNTYHLWQSPGHEVIQRLGGVHRFSGWHGPILSDSGGFQVFSLKGIRKITEQGVEFRSHLNGQKCFLSPELAIEIQECLGVNIAMCLDECPPASFSAVELERSLARTHRWEKRCLAARKKSDMALFGITQGAVSHRYRSFSAELLSELDFDGMAIGGLSVGEPPEQMYEVLSYHARQLPSHKPRYLMGVGTPIDIVTAVREGIDMFDCVIPTRSGRFGRAYIAGPNPVLNIKNAEHKESPLPLDEFCECLCCQTYSRAYVHHLFRMDEMLGPQLLSIHNLHYYLSLMSKIRQAIAADAYEEFYELERKRWSDHENL
ncbi:MAG: tRNA guanosine(34) transglycosylase Tgt [Bdellovibrionales bacterium]|nr:tRNA guanosine(34) transglycosylase Tgt [Bdellovibrionales bacterium]